MSVTAFALSFPFSSEDRSKGDLWCQLTCGMKASCPGQILSIHGWSELCEALNWATGPRGGADPWVWNTGGNTHIHNYKSERRVVKGMKTKCHGSQRGKYSEKLPTGDVL